MPTITTTTNKKTVLQQQIYIYIWNLKIKQNVYRLLLIFYMRLIILLLMLINHLKRRVHIFFLTYLSSSSNILSFFGEITIILLFLSRMFIIKDCYLTNFNYKEYLWQDLRMVLLEISWNMCDIWNKFNKMNISLFFVSCKYIYIYTNHLSRLSMFVCLFVAFWFTFFFRILFFCVFFSFSCFVSYFIGCKM